MAKTGTCSECPTVLENPKAKTCSPSCRSKRSRRLARGRKKAGQNSALPPELKHLSEAARKEITDVLPEVVRQELRPVVREAITEDVLRAASDLVGLTPLMVAAIHDDLMSDDKDLRQKAYTLLAKFTLGNQSIAPKADAPSAQAMQVVFHLPRPGDEPTQELSELEDVNFQVDAVELRPCIECHQDKTDAEFVAGSERCLDCHAAVQARVQARFGES